ncbi:hypothetical protein LMH73_022445 [Vibrio splendidus]|nr:hypothetical protein [Vibrio splendidus]MCC4878467.1 hypothetical protein [Vibrio splendidus]
MTQILYAISVVLLTCFLFPKFVNLYVNCYKRGNQWLFFVVLMAYCGAVYFGSSMADTGI